MRKMPDKPLFDIADPHSDFGKVSYLPREKWLKENAPRVQLGLDQLRAWVEESKSKVKISEVTQKPLLCRSSRTPEDAGEPAFSSSEVQDVAGRLRRFQLLMNDCKKMRDSAAKLSPEIGSDEDFFGKSGSYHGNKLNCYKKDGEQECLQLNCYTDPIDTVLRHRVRDWKSQVDECVSEEIYKWKARKKEEAAAAEAETEEAKAEREQRRQEKEAELKEDLANADGAQSKWDLLLAASKSEHAENQAEEQAAAAAEAAKLQPGADGVLHPHHEMAEAHGESAHGVAGEIHPQSAGPGLALCALARPRGVARPRAGPAWRPRPAAPRARRDAAAFL